MYGEWYNPPMFAKLSLKSVVRTPGKTLLFLLLLSGGIAFLCLGVGMWVSAQNLLADADKNYSTVAYIEYIGENYPDANQLDDFMVEELSSYDPTPLFNQPGVLSCDRQTVLGATVETLFPGTRSTRLFINTGVLRFKVYYVKEEAIVCMIMGQPLFAGDKYYDGVFFNLSYTELADMGIDAARLERGKQFMANGSFYVGENRSLWFRIEPCLLNVPDSYREFAACPFFVIEDPNDYTDTLPYEMLYKMAETYKTLSSQLRICASDYP